jgi:hypothetical protein
MRRQAGRRARGRDGSGGGCGRCSAGVRGRAGSSVVFSVACKNLPQLLLPFLLTNSYARLCTSPAQVFTASNVFACGTATVKFSCWKGQCRVQGGQSGGECGAEV